MESVHGDASRGDIDGPVAVLRAVITDHVQAPPPTDDEDLNDALRENWSFIKTKLKRGVVANMLNVRLWNGLEEWQMRVMTKAFGFCSKDPGTN